MVLRIFTLYQVLSPLIGIILMEMGIYSIGTYENGYPNYASVAYVFYLGIIYIAYRISSRNRNTIQETKIIKKKTHLSFDTTVTITVVNLFFLFLMLFYFGGIKVWLGTLGKGEFRISLGFFGFFAFIITKYISPLFLAYLSVFYEDLKKTKLTKFLFSLNFVILFLLGATWGYKSTALILIMPSIIILFWRAKLLKVGFLLVLAFSFLVIFSVFFDSRELSGDASYSNLADYTESYSGGGSAIEFVVYRATVLQGDVAWKVWDMYTSEKPLPNYFKTWLSIIGDKNLSIIFGVDRSNFANFMQYHYGYILTYLAGASIQQIENGHSITGTAFSEGIIAGGIVGLVIFSIFAGLLMGYIVKQIKFGIETKQPIITSFASMYYVLVFLPWLTGGGVIDSFFHISIVSGLILSYYLLKLITKIRYVWL